MVLYRLLLFVLLYLTHGRTKFIIWYYSGYFRATQKNKQQYSFDCPTCSAEKGEYEGDGKGNLEINLAEGVYHCWACGKK